MNFSIGIMAGSLRVNLEPANLVVVTGDDPVNAEYGGGQPHGTRF